MRCDTNSLGKRKLINDHDFSDHGVHISDGKDWHEYLHIVDLNSKEALEWFFITKIYIREGSTIK